MEELDGANLVCPVSYASTETLHYFDAVVKEAARMHPGVGLILERVVPAEGLMLADGRILSPGTVVGMNAWVVHQNKEIFGEDAEYFNPDRWLQSSQETEEVCRGLYLSIGLLISEFPGVRVLHSVQTPQRFFLQAILTHVMLTIKLGTSNSGQHNEES